MIKAKIDQKKLVAEKTFEVSFLLEENFSFQAGQYIKLILPKLLYPDERGESRFFSIVTSPKEKEKMAIAFRDTQSGFKKTLLELPLGTEVFLEGPFGEMTLPKDFFGDLVFLAGGIGITPFLSMIRFAKETQWRGLISLLYFNRSEGNAAYLEELREYFKQGILQLEEKYGPLDLGSLQEIVLKKKEALWYLAGPEPFVSLGLKSLTQLGIPKEKIILENFVGY